MYYTIYIMKIMILADTHYDIGIPHLHYPQSKPASDGFFNWLKEESKLYDLIVICGDISVRGAFIADEIEYVKNFLDTLSTPYICIPGNHDLCPLKGMEKRYPELEEYEYCELEKTNFYKVFKEDGVRYSKVINGFQFVGFAIRDEDPDEQLKWLEKQLENNNKKFVFCHFPIIPTRETGFCSTWDYFRIGNTYKDIKKIVDKKSNNVISYFCGHQHVNSIVKMDNAYHIETASAVLGPCSYREMIIENEEIKITTKSLPYINEYLGIFLGDDVTRDINHTTTLEYYCGVKEDLELTIKNL